MKCIKFSGTLSYKQILSKRLHLVSINKEKRSWPLVDFAVPADHRIKIKESAKIDKYLDHARELKRLWNMKVMVVPVVVGALAIVF